jgi:hypothetical protein
MPQQPDLAGLKIADGVVTVPIGRRLDEVRAIYCVPTINLDTASAETRRGARAKWGAILKGLPHPIHGPTLALAVVADQAVVLRRGVHLVFDIALLVERVGRDLAAQRPGCG